MRPGDLGPCYDYCACRNCWKGWTKVPFLRRVWWRFEYILKRRHW
jgi:hypothetical protein